MNIEINNLEKLKAEFINDDWLIEPEYFNYRINYNGQRHYARCYENRLENGEMEYKVLTAPSFSVISSSVIPKGYGLEEWLKNKSADEIDFFLKNSAIYGTCFHVYAGQILRGEKIIPSEAIIFKEMQNYCLEQGESWDDLRKWIKKEKRNIVLDLIAFAKWIKDYNVVPIAIEYPVFSEKCAGTIDLVAWITIPIEYTKDELVDIALKTEKELSVSAIKKLRKDEIIEKYNIKKSDKVLALIDLKTGTKSFYDTNIMQLYQYMKCWNEEHPNLQIQRIYNYGSANYKLPEFKYRFKDQTDNEKLFKKWDKYVEIYYIDEYKRPTKYFDIDVMQNIDPENIDNILIEIDPIQKIIDIQKGFEEKEAF